MRFAFILTFVVSLTSLSAKATIEVIITGEVTSTEIVTFIPSEGDYLGITYKTPKAILKEGIARIDIDIDKPGFARLQGPFEVVNGGNWVRLYVEPGGEYTVIGDNVGGEQSLIFNGTNAKLNTLLNEKRRGDARYPSNKYLIEPFMAADDPDEIVRLLEQAKQQELSSFTSIAGLSDETIAYLQADAELYYYSLLSGVMSDIAFEYSPGKASMLESWKVVARKQFMPSRNSIYDRASAWLPRYVESKKSTHIYLRAEEVKEKFGGKDVYDVRWPLIKMILPAEDVETATANLLFLEINRNPGLAITRKEFSNFINAYPGSFYTPSLKRLATKAWGDKLVVTAKSENLVETHTFDLIEDVLNAGEHDIVYVDLWATWCGPCKKGFLKKGRLDAFQEAYADRLGLLYISIDKKANSDKKIQEIVDHYGLRGRVLRASEALRQQLFEKLTQSGSLSIPRYLIMSREGRVLNANAASPGDWYQLRSQLEDALR